MDLLINGQKRTLDTLPGQPVVADLLAALGMAADRVAVEQNGEIVPRASWAHAALAGGDKFEIVHFVGGGGF